MVEGLIIKRTIEMDVKIIITDLFPNLKKQSTAHIGTLHCLLMFKGALGMGDRVSSEKAAEEG